MNRETKRMMQRQGQMEADGSPPSRRPPPGATRGAPGGGGSGAGAQGRARRTAVPQFFREVREELRQVAWPTREEMVNYVAVVLSTLVFMIVLIFILNWVFGKGVIWMFQK